MANELTDYQTNCKAGRTGVLYLVATPIGNRADMTERARDILQHVDRIACEDTRTSKPLLQHYGITTPCSAYHAHNEQKATEALLAQLQSGEDIAIISDAGSPLISDPGAVIVRAAHATGIQVVPIPGASALIAALSASGLCDGPFYFSGFLPRENKPRAAVMRQLQAMRCTCVLYEAPHRIAKTLSALAEIMPEREACLAREITKRFETFYHGSIAELAKQINAKPVKGECVLILAAPQASIDNAADDASLSDAMLRDALARLPATKAAAEVAAATGQPRKALYARALAMKDHATKP